MKKLLLIVFFSIGYLFVSAQDTILKRNGDKVIAKVLEISLAEVKYKKFNFQDGPTYVDNKSGIKTIKYSNGAKDEFQEEVIQSSINNYPASGDYYKGFSNSYSNKIEQLGRSYYFRNSRISELELHSVLLRSNDKKITGLVNSAEHARIMQHIGFAAIPFGIASYMSLVYLSSGSHYHSPSSSNTFLIIGGACFVGTIAFSVAPSYYKQKRNKLNYDAVTLYNQKF